MSDDLISRQAAIDAYLKTVEPIAVREWDGEISACARDRNILEMLENLPNVQPKTGHWKHVEIESNKSDTGYFMLPLCECSACGIYVEQETNYCPHCGAKMKGEKNG